LTHDADKLIRQLSLVAYLMAEQRPITARDVKLNVEGYANMKDEAYARRFFADRSELRALGVPITSARDEFTGEELYNLEEEQYFLPPVELSDEELAALQTCFYLLEGQFAYAEPLRLALQNLALGRAHPSIDPGPKTATVRLLGGGYTPEIAQRMAKLEQAISKQRTVRFTYYTIGRDAEGERTVNPYGLYELEGHWYVVGADLAAPEDERRKTFRISRIRGEIKFATRRERDFRMPADFDVAAYRDRSPWMLAAEPREEAVVRVSPDATWFVERFFGRHGTLEELDDGGARFHTPFSDAHALSSWILGLGGRALPEEPAWLVEEVRRDLEAVANAHARPAPAIPPPQAAPDPEPAGDERAPAQGPVAPERFAVLQSMLAYLLQRCGDEESTTVPAAELEARFRLGPDELREHLDLLNLVNFGGGCYAVYCLPKDGSIRVDKELYGDTFRRPARLSPLEAKALLRALDVVAPLVAAEAHTSLSAVRRKVEAAFGRFTLSDTPPPQAAGGEEETVTVLNEGVRQRRLVRMTYLSRSSDELSSRLVEPYLLRRGERGWYVETYDRTRGGPRTFKVSYVKEATLTDERYEPRGEMRELRPSLGGEVGTALVRFSRGRARYELEGRPGVRLTDQGEAVAAVPYGSLEWLTSEILRFRGEAEVVEPAHVRARVRAAAERLLERFLGEGADRRPRALSARPR